MPVASNRALIRTATRCYSARSTARLLSTCLLQTRIPLPAPFFFSFSCDSSYSSPLVFRFLVPYEVAVSTHVQSRLPVFILIFLYLRSTRASCESATCALIVLHLRPSNLGIFPLPSLQGFRCMIWYASRVCVTLRRCIPLLLDVSLPGYCDDSEER